MLRVTVEGKQPPRMVLEGTLVGPWAEEVRQVWQGLFQQSGCRLVVDLTGVSQIDWEGRLLLAAMSQEGADLQASGCYMKAMLQDITGSQEK